MQEELVIWDGRYKRKAKEVICQDCKKRWIIRKDRASPKLCRTCNFKGKNNPGYGKKPHNYINGNRAKECTSNYLRNQRTKRKLEIIKYMGNECAKCGAKNLPICCYHVHHINDDEKIFSVMSKLNDGKFYRNNKALMKQEIEKCELLCIHCHKIHHFGSLKVSDVPVEDF